MQLRQRVAVDVRESCICVSLKGAHFFTDEWQRRADRTHVARGGLFAERWFEMRFDDIHTARAA